MNNKKVVKNIKSALSYLRDIDRFGLDGQSEDYCLKLAIIYLNDSLKELEELDNDNK